jgi:hypothetical protein
VHRGDYGYRADPGGNVFYFTLPLDDTTQDRDAATEQEESEF